MSKEKIILNQNMAIIGISGSGKTTFVNDLLENTPRNVFDSFICVSDEKLLLKHTSVRIHPNKGIKKIDNSEIFSSFIEMAKSATSSNKNICFILDEFETLVTYFGSIEKAEEYLKLFKALNVTFVITARGNFPNKESIKIHKLHTLSTKKSIFYKYTKFIYPVLVSSFIVSIPVYKALDVSNQLLSSIMAHIGVYSLIGLVIYMFFSTIFMFIRTTKKLYNTRLFRNYRLVLNLIYSILTLSFLGYIIINLIIQG